MIVCLCNAITCAEVRAAIAGGATRPREVYCACGKSAQCGGCTATILSMLREVPTQRAA